MKNTITMTQEEIRTMINEEVFKNIVRSREMTEWEERNLDNHINGLEYDFPDEVPFPEVDEKNIIFDNINDLTAIRQEENDRLVQNVLSKIGVSLEDYLNTKRF